MLSNPIVVRMAIVLFVMGFGLWVATLLLRRMRRILTEESFAIDSAPELEQFPMHTYNAVIQQLKQQKHELQVQSQAEQQRARTTENFSQTVLSNLSCGVLVFGSNGLVKTANPAAKCILGFASTTGMSARDIFRASPVHSSAFSSAGVFRGETADTPVQIVDEVDAVLREGSKRREIEADYEVPFLAHAPMEPLNCTADVNGDRCAVWASTQGQSAARDIAARITGLPPEKIDVHTLYMGGGFGRRAAADYIGEAVEVSKAVSAPVKLTWSREDDLQQDLYRPASYTRFAGALDAAGWPLALSSRIACPPFGGVRNGLAFQGWPKPSKKSTKANSRMSARVRRSPQT